MKKILIDWNADRGTFLETGTRNTHPYNDTLDLDGGKIVISPVLFYIS
jgi:hypothetical protein